jgi:HEAT repeat protein
MRRLPSSVALVVAAVLFGTVAAQMPGQLPPPTPTPRSGILESVEAFRQALLADSDIPRADEPERKATRDAMLAYRKKHLDRLAADLTTPRAIVRVLVLREWRYDDPDTDIADIDLKVFQGLEARFLAAMKKHARSNVPAERNAVASLTGEMASLVPVPPAGTAGLRVRRFIVAELLPVVVGLAKDRSPAVEADVARALGRIQSNSRDVRTARDPSTKSIFATLRQLQDSPNRATRRGVADSLSLMLQYYSPQEKDPKPVVRPTNRAELERIVFEILDNVVPLAFRGLNDPSLGVRRVNVDTLQRIVTALILEQEIRLSAQPTSYPPPDRKPTAEELKRMREDRAALLQELGRLRPRLATFDPLVRDLRRALNDRDSEYRRQVLRLTEDMALLRDRIRQRLQAIPEVEPEKKPKPEKTGQADKAELQFVAQPGGEPAPPGALLDRILKEAEPDLVRALNDASSEVRLSALHVIENLGPEARDLAPHLVRHLRDRNLFVRWVSARTLGRLGTPPPAGAVAGLARLVYDHDLSVRAAAALALEQYGPAAADAVPALVRMVNVGDAEARQLIIRALGAIGTGGREVVLAIARELTNEDVRVRRAASQALGNFGAEAAPAAAALERALRDDDAEVRRNASESLLNIPAR